MLAIISRIVPAALAHKRDPSEVQPVVGNGQSIALCGHEQILCRHLEVLEDDALVVRVLECPQTVLCGVEIGHFLAAASRR